MNTSLEHVYRAKQSLNHTSDADAFTDNFTLDTSHTVACCSHMGCGLDAKGRVAPPA